jgi:PKD repeat protein
MEDSPQASARVVLRSAVLLAGKDTVQSTLTPDEDTPRLHTAGATLQIEGLETFPAEMHAAVRKATSIWENQLTSSVPIVVEVRWEKLSDDVLASGGPYTLLEGRTWYPLSLINKRRGTDQDGQRADMVVRVNSAMDWYTGVDGACPPDRFDLVTAVVHEIGHGLGFTGSLAYFDGQGSWGEVAADGNVYPHAFDRFVVNGAGEDMFGFGNPSRQLGEVLTGGQVFFDGAFAVEAADGFLPRLYAPADWRAGKSIYHLDETTYAVGHEDSLMTPMLQSGEAIHGAGPVTRGMLRDIGWVEHAAIIPRSPTPTDAPTVSPTPTASPTVVPSPTPRPVRVSLVSSSPVYLGQTTFFTATVSGNYSRVVWEFGDGVRRERAEQLAETQYTYTSMGTYTATVRLFAADGRLLATDAVSVAVTAPALRVAVAPTLVGQTTWFTASVMGEYDGLAWDFGDGSPHIPRSALRHRAHTYAAAGIYTVTVRLFFADASSPLEKQVAVSVVPLVFAQSVPAVLGAATYFTATVSPYRRYAAVRWDFGDGAGLGTGLHVRHWYTQPGVYTVRAWLADMEVYGSAYPGDLTGLQQQIQVLTPSLDLDIGQAAVNETTLVTATVGQHALHEPLSLVFDFGDGTESVVPVTATNQVRSAHIYTRTGGYTLHVGLQAGEVYGGGLIASEAVSVAVGYGPAAHIVLGAGDDVLEADGESSTIVQAHVMDRHGHGLAGQEVHFLATLGDILPVVTRTDEQGIARALLRSAPVAGMGAVGARSGGVGASIRVEFVVSGGVVYLPLVRQ